MTWDLNDGEYEYVTGLPPQQRYDYFIKKVVDHGALWGVATDEGWAVMGDDYGLKHLPVWPHSRYAEAAVENAPLENTPRAILIQDWIDAWLPGMHRDNLQIAVFPTAEGEGVSVTAAQMRWDLEDERSRWAGDSGEEGGEDEE